MPASANRPALTITPAATASPQFERRQATAPEASLPQGSLRGQQVASSNMGDLISRVSQAFIRHQHLQQGAGQMLGSSQASVQGGLTQGRALAIQHHFCQQGDQQGAQPTGQKAILLAPHQAQTAACLGALPHPRQELAGPGAPRAGSAPLVHPQISHHVQLLQAPREASQQPHALHAQHQGSRTLIPVGADRQLIARGIKRHFENLLGDSSSRTPGSPAECCAKKPNLMAHQNMPTEFTSPMFPGHGHPQHLQR